MPPSFVWAKLGVVNIDLAIETGLDPTFTPADFELIHFSCHVGRYLGLFGSESWLDGHRIHAPQFKME